LASCLECGGTINSPKSWLCEGCIEKAIEMYDNTLVQDFVYKDKPLDVEFKGFDRTNMILKGDI